MIWPSGYFRALLLLSVARCCFGCGQLMAPFAMKSPYADGTWTGRLVSVTVEDTKGQQHVAAALDIESGPRTLRSSIGEHTVPRENVPYLAPVGVGIVDPQSLRAPVGSRVRVRGRMILAGVGVSVEDIPGKPKVFRSVYRIPGEPPGDATVIQMREKPSVIHE